jgi:hypothetical protein
MHNSYRRAAFPLLAILAFTLQACPASSEPLPALRADLTRTTVSGLSSGAYMAGQFQIAYSRLVIGAGLIAGGPYGCARTPGTELNPFWAVVLSWNSYRAQNQCMEDGWFFSSVPDPAGLVEYAEHVARDGKIDPLEALRGDRVYIFSSRKDDTVERGVVEATAAFYRKAGVPEPNISFVIHDKAAHSFLTETEGLACGQAGPPFLNDCDYDQAKAVLQQLYTTLQPARPAVDASFLRFEQTPFLSGLTGADFDGVGMAYIPADCRALAGCAVHVVFHGCKQGLAAVGEQFVKGSGYARWAESNRMIVLFPQVGPGAFNPNGCWDWWGYTGPRFLERDAPQMLGVKRMIDRLAATP